MIIDEHDVPTGGDVPVIAGYAELSRIGRGGFATVFRGVDIAFGRNVAIKVLDSDDVTEDERRRFERECRAVGSLSGHPGIVTVYGAGATADGRPYIAMDLLERGSLSDRLRHDGPLPAVEAVVIGKDLADALAAAHELGILHRDIKPDNVLVSRFGNSQLADFGIASMPGGYETKSGDVTATMGFAAPEVINGERASQASDVYSLAATVGSLVLGAPVFARGRDENLMAYIRRILTEPPPDLSTVGASPELAQVLGRGMAKAMTSRYGSAAEFGAALTTVPEWRATGRATMATPAVAVWGDPNAGHGEEPDESEVEATVRRAPIAAAAPPPLVPTAEPPTLEPPTLEPSPAAPALDEPVSAIETIPRGALQPGPPAAPDESPVPLADLFNASPEGAPGAGGRRWLVAVLAVALAGVLGAGTWLVLSGSHTHVAGSAQSRPPHSTPRPSESHPSTAAPPVRRIQSVALKSGTAGTLVVKVTVASPKQCAPVMVTLERRKAAIWVPVSTAQMAGSERIHLAADGHYRARIATVRRRTSLCQGAISQVVVVAPKPQVVVPTRTTTQPVITTHPVTTNPNPPPTQQPPPTKKKPPPPLHH